MIDPNQQSPKAQQAKTLDYDVIIVGGGIYGAAMLWEASHRGLRSLLIERSDFGSGTSANSLKTIHGGIRYLQQFDFKRCYESDREKVILRKIAPNLITPLKCAVQSQASLTSNVWAMRAGAFLMNRISQLSTLGSGRNNDLFNPATVKKLAPFLSQSSQSPASAQAEKTNYLTWEDAQVLDSERLCMAFIDASIQTGATALNYTTVNQVESHDSGAAYAVHCVNSNETSPQTYQFSAAAVIDCSANSALKQSQSNQTSGYVAGVNLVVDHAFSEYAVAIPQALDNACSSSERDQAKGMLFLSPWRGITLAGTWYYHTDQSTLDQDFVEQCCQRLHAALAQQGIEMSLEELNNKVVDVHFGFLPCKINEHNAERSIINQCAVHQIDENWFRVEGNKYTTARLNAKKMIDRLAQKNDSIEPSESHRRRLEFAQKCNYPKHAVWDALTKRYAQHASLMKDYYELADIETRNSLLSVLPNSDVTQIEVDYFAQDQHVTSLADLVYRRLNFNKALPLSNDFISACCDRLALIRQWTPEQTNTNLEHVFNTERSKQFLSQKTN